MVLAALALPKETVPGPATRFQVTVVLPGEVGKPSSLTEPLRVSELTGNVIDWSAPALTIGALLPAEVGVNVLVAVGAAGVLVAVGGTGVNVLVAVGGTGVLVAVGGTGVLVAVGGTGVLVAVGAPLEYSMCSKGAAAATPS